MAEKDQNYDELEVLIRARYPIINIISWEEERITEHLERIAKSRGKKLYTWSFNTGIVPFGVTVESKNKNDASTKDPLQALNKVIENIEPAIFLFKDFHPFMAERNYAIVRRLREVSDSLKNSYKTLVLVMPHMRIGDDLEKDVTILDYPLPDTEILRQLLQRIIEDVKDNPKIEVNIDDRGMEEMLQAALGLTLKEAENVFAKTLITKGRIDTRDIGIILEEKKQIIRKSGILEYYEAQESFENIGGLDLLKEWLSKRSLAFSENARKFGLPAPKGALFLGIQGCGKSLSAKAVSAAWQMPLLRFDAGRLFESALGSSEENLRKAIKVAESVSPCILWIDEIEKAFGGAGSSSGQTDGGTSARIFGSLLTWLAEKTAPVFVIATANDISRLPPELLRKGRFDEIFFIDLPNPQERFEIFHIQLVRRGRDPEAYDLSTLAYNCEGFNGAEIEEVVVSALYEAYYAGRELLQEDMEKSIKDTVPLSRTMKEHVKNLREWCQARARPASTYYEYGQSEQYGGRSLELE
jgi:ATP-dependent 26S proteasome regulatory subunit